MKAIIWTAYGPPEVLRYQEVAKPTPKPDEVLIRICASNIFPGDCELRRFDLQSLFWLPIRLYIGAFKPRFKILGQEYAGIIEAVGSHITTFKSGDAVFAPTAFIGSYAEYICAKPTVMLPKPENMSFEEAATVPVGGLNALHFCRSANIQPGQKVLIYGAAGSIGTWAVQLAKVMGAEVTAIDSTDKISALLALGADHVIDYTREDFTARAEVYDAIIDVVGKSPYSLSLKCINSNGCYILGNASAWNMLRSVWSRITVKQRVKTVLTGYKADDLAYLKELVEASKIHAVIDRVYQFDDIVAAHHYIEAGTKVGNVVMTVSHANS